MDVDAHHRALGGGRHEIVQTERQRGQEPLEVRPSLEFRDEPRRVLGGGALLGDLLRAGPAAGLRAPAQRAQPVQGGPQPGVQGAAIPRLPPSVRRHVGAPPGTTSPCRAPRAAWA
ncbi:hypothetical protein [Streptomyces cyanogenus]|uniref:hypothetical protein n=1 Tax=Streptomyces cyanogenus TaxID=80860 RepID=UPI001FB63235|nr:hypothetical protein [Streptomyces cyanogenus]